MILPPLVTTPQSIGVAIEREADFRIGLLQYFYQILQILRSRWIRVMIRKISIDLGKQFGHLAAKAPEQARRDHAADAVAAVDRHLDRTRELYVADDAFHVRVEDILRSSFAEPAGEFGNPRFDAAPQSLDFFSCEGVAGDDHLQTVVFPGVVAARHHHRAAAAEVVGGEISDRRGHHADVDHVRTGGVQAVHERRAQFGTGEPAVAAHGEGGRAAFAARHAPLASERP